MELDSLVIALGLDPDGVRQGLREAENTINRGVNAIEQDIVQGAQQGMQKAESVIDSGLQNIKNAFLGLAVGGGFAMMFDQFVTGASNVKKYSDMLNMSMADLQAWRGAAVAMGGEAESVDEMLIDMTEHLSDMVHNASGPAQEILPKLGISAKDASGKMKTAADVLLEIAAAGEKIGKEQMLAYGKIFGFDKQVIDMLQKGRGSLLELLAAQKELAVYNKEDAEIAKKAKMAMGALFNALQAGAAIIMRVLVPPITVLITWLTKMVSFIRQNQTTAAIFFGLIAGVLVAKFIPALYAMATAGWAAIAPFLPFIALFAAIALVVEDFITYINGGESALAEFWAIFGTGPELAAAFGKGMELVKEALAAVWKFIKHVASALATSFGPALEPLKQMFIGFLTFIKGLFTGDFTTMFEGLKTIGKNFIDYIQALFMGFINLIPNLFGASWEQIGQHLFTVFQNAMAAIGNMFTEFFAWLWNKLTGMFDFVGDSISSVGNFFGFGDDDDKKKAPAQKTAEAFKSNVSYVAGTANSTMPMAGVGNMQQNVNNNSQSTTNISAINVQTQATDAAGISRGIGGAVRGQFNNMPHTANSGVITK